MKQYMRLSMDDDRPLDEWGKPIGRSYKQKDWAELTPDEMMADFEWKSDVLAAFGEEVAYDSFYQDYLFRDLYAGELAGDYKVILTEYDAEKGKKTHKIDVDEIMDYLHLKDAALSPCLFYGNWRRKALLNYVGAFVLDIDKLRPAQLQRFCLLFAENRLLTPTFIANSGSGVHFYYVLDKMLPCDAGRNEANNLIAEEIYRRLYDDVIIKEKWKDAQRHWLGQDYRVVNSRTKFNQVSQIFKIGEVYTIEQLINYSQAKVDPQKHYATKGMIQYANSIAKDLDLAVPDYTDFGATYAFIKDNKDAAYLVRKERRELREQRDQKRRKKNKKASKPQTWYKRTLDYMYDHTQAGYRFSAMKALAMIAFKEKVPKEVFWSDVCALSAYWETVNWKGDSYNTKNLEAIERFFDAAEKYGNTTSKTLEDWLGYEFRRIGTKRNGRNRSDHVKVMNAMKQLKKQLGEEVKDGRPAGSGTAQAKVAAYRAEHPEASVTEVARALQISRTTVYKWWGEK